MMRRGSHGAMDREGTTAAEKGIPRSQARCLGLPILLRKGDVPFSLTSAFGGGEALVDLVPVDDAPPCGEVVGAAVLVLEVVGVLPDVVEQDGIEALGKGRVLVGGGDYLELAGM